MNAPPIPQKILLIQPSFIGDTILAMALVEQLAHQYPKVDIDFLCRKGNELLFDNHPHLRDILVWDKKQKKYQNWWAILLQIRQAKYDWIINLHRFGSSGLWTVLSGAKWTTGFDKNPFANFYSIRRPHLIDIKNESHHEIDRNASLIPAVNDTTRFLPKLYPSKSDFQSVKREQKYITIAPFSVWATKEIPWRKWHILLSKMPDDIDILLIGGPADTPRAKEFVARMNGLSIEIWTGKLSFLQSAALMKNAKMNYVLDSAPLHIASAMDAPVTVFFCSTVPAFGFTPLSTKARVVETAHKLTCRPCGLHGKRKCPEGHFRCGDVGVDSWFDQPTVF